MQIVVFGAGGVGGYFGGRLAQAGADVAFVARGVHLQALQTHGLRVDSGLGNFVIQPVRATADPTTLGPAALVIVAVKAWQVTEAAQAIKPVVGPDTLVLPLQNGVEAAAELAAVLGPACVLGGLCRLISQIAAPGHIVHSGGEPYMALGELDNTPSARVTALHAMLAQAAGLRVEIAPDIQKALWEKFMLIAAFSGVGAITRMPMGVIRQTPEAWALLEAAAGEIWGLARERGVALPAAALTQALQFFQQLPPGGTASMQRDILAGQPSELEYQTGAVVRLGQAANFPTPVNHFIYSALVAQERQARGQLAAR